MLAARMRFDAVHSRHTLLVQWRFSTLSHLALPRDILIGLL
ncbi:MAG: hypothetical protein OJF49_002245 [Ktedonobacterales bacterium]|nr:MAG: hypothetical protein OJF49_002245 [Ktedonobacterales bacterium]